MFADMTWEALAAHSAARNLIVNGLQRDWIPRAVVAKRYEAVGAAAHWRARGMTRWQSVCGSRELWVSSFRVASGTARWRLLARFDDARGR